MTERSASAVAYEALNLSKQNERDIEGHEEICAERYQNIHDKLGMLFKIIAWAGGTGFLVIMGLLSYLAKTQFESISALQKAVVQRTEILEHAQSIQPQVIIQRAPGQPPLGATIEQQPVR